MVTTRIQTDPLETITDNFLKIQYFNAFVNKLRKVITGLVIIVHCPSVYPHRRARLYEWKHFVFNSPSFPCVLRTLSIAFYITPIIFGEYIIMQYSRLLVTRTPLHSTSLQCSAGERPAAAHLLRSWVRIPRGAWIFVCCECRVLSGTGLCDELITRPEESYRM